MLFRFPDNTFSYQFNSSLANLYLAKYKFIQRVSDFEEPIFYALSEDCFVDMRTPGWCRVVTSAVPQTQGQSSQPKAFNPEIDVQHFPFVEKKRKILLLTDFYQHPLAISHFIQHLSKSAFEVVCPYMGDVVTKCVTCIDEDLQSSLLAHLYQIVKVFVNGDF